VAAAAGRLTLWRYLLRRDRLGGESLDWSAVFPLGMYSAATFHLVNVVDLPFLHPLAAAFFWLALAAWAATLLAKARALRAGTQDTATA
jgi:tellurite resistance protein TehA-like permease